MQILDSFCELREGKKYITANNTTMSESSSSEGITAVNSTETAFLTSGP